MYSNHNSTLLTYYELLPFIKFSEGGGRGGGNNFEIVQGILL